MKGYLHIAKAEYMAYTMYPISLFFTLVGNIVYIIVVYFLWRQIYNGADTLHGMTFNETFVYLTLAGSILILFKNWTEWFIANQVRDGSIVMFLLKPQDYQFQMLAYSLGTVLFNGLVVTLPSIAVVLLVFHASIPAGLNLLFLPISIVLAYLLSFTIDYMVGLTSFYTQSIWGISTTKDVVVSVLAGALIPLQFFPDAIRQVLQYLPFQAIYSTPLKIATAYNLTLTDYVQLIGVQLFWVVVLMTISRLAYRKAITVVTVNGG